MQKHLLMGENIKKILPEISLAISECMGEGINGGIYFYQKNECSCCYGSKDLFFEIAGNTATNWGDYKAGKDREDFKISFNHDQKKADIVAKIIRKHLRGTGYKLDWNGDILTAMFIRKQK